MRHILQELLAAIALVGLVGTLGGMCSAVLSIAFAERDTKLYDLIGKVWSVSFVALLVAGFLSILIS